MRIFCQNYLTSGYKIVSTIWLNRINSTLRQRKRGINDMAPSQNDKI